MSAKVALGSLNKTAKRNENNIMGAASCVISYLEAALLAELAAISDGNHADVARFSIALGLVEASLTAKDPAQQLWPELSVLEAQVDACAAAVRAFAADQAARLPPPGQSAPSRDASRRAAVKAVADAVWSKLTGSFSKDVPHAQHVSSFARALQPAPAGGPPPRRQLDCAGVVTTTYAVCADLARRHGHADLLDALHVCISEDHCFISLDPLGGRAATVEVTADTAAKRGLPAAPELWAGWLYAGGFPVVCSPGQLLAALVTSLNPSISGGKKGVDSEHLQAVQRALLRLLRAQRPAAAMYPAATCALADLEEIAETDAAAAAAAAGDGAAAAAALRRADGGAQALFEEAIAAAGGARGEMDTECRQWYPFSYAVGFLCRRAALAAACAAAFPLDAPSHRQLAEEAFREALGWAAAGAGVLANFRFHPADDQLYKDVGEGVLESLTDGLHAYAKAHALQGAPLLEDASLLAPLLTLWDGVCVLFTGRAKPAAWLGLVLRAARLFSPAARGAAAAAATARAEPMRAARPLWAALKPAALRPLFEAADVGGGGEGRAGKRQRAS
jgi:hypothetical protein